MSTTRLLSEEQLGLEPDSGPGCETGIELKTWNGKARCSERGLVWLHSPWVLPTFCLSSALSSVCMAMISSERALLDRVDQASHTLIHRFQPVMQPVHVIFASFHKGLGAVSTHSRASQGKIFAFFIKCLHLSEFTDPCNSPEGGKTVLTTPLYR